MGIVRPRAVAAGLSEVLVVGLLLKEGEHEGGDGAEGDSDVDANMRAKI